MILHSYPLVLWLLMQAPQQPDQPPREHRELPHAGAQPHTVPLFPPNPSNPPGPQAQNVPRVPPNPMRPGQPLWFLTTQMPLWLVFILAVRRQQQAQAERLKVLADEEENKTLYT